MMIPVTFTSSESIVRGYFFPSATKSVVSTVIFLQGFPGVEGDELVCERLARVGLNILTFNYRGTFQSEGYFSFSNAVADIGAALNFLKSPQSLKTYQINPDMIVLGGWSFGGGIVPAGAVQNPAFTRVVTITGRNFGKEARKIKKDPEYSKQVEKNLESLRAPKGPVNFQDDLISGLIEYQDSLDSVKLAPLLKDRDMLLICAWNDDFVPIEDNTLPFYRSLLKNGADKVRIEAFQDDHEFSNSKDRIVEVVLDWLGK